MRVRSVTFVIALIIWAVSSILAPRLLAAQAIDESKGTVVSIIIQTDIPCLFSVDSKTTYKGTPSFPTVIKVPIGSRKITAVSLDGKDIWQTTFAVEREGRTLAIALEPVKTWRMLAESQVAALRLQNEHTRQENEQARARNTAYKAETNKILKLNSFEANIKRAQANRRRAAVADSISKWEQNYDVFIKSAGIYTSSSQSITTTAGMNPPTTLGSLAQLLEYGMAAGQHSKATKNLLGARVTMKLIVHATNWIGASYEADDLDKLWAQDDPTVLRVFGPNGIGRLTLSNSPCFSYHQESAEATSKTADIFSVEISEIKSVHPPGIPIIRSFKDLNEGTKFVLVTSKGKYEFKAMSKEDRADIFGFLYAFCPR